MIKDNELYDLKYRIADFVLPRLRAYKEKFDKNESPSAVIFEEEEKKLGRALTPEESNKIWSEILDKMIFPFACLSEPESFDEMKGEEKRERMKKGLELFANHFEDLWI